ncbi:MAG TPA: cytochrome P450 [Solirubrobacterales bacterium]|nr:cytochrome P450 [Solirubrobacterales bacterium]
MSLPPGPRMPRALQALGWTNRALPWLEHCRERYGDAFTLRIRHWGDWVLLADPADVKAVFTAGEKVGVALANPLLGPLLGPSSMMLSEEPDHMRRRRIVLPAFHGEAIANDAATITAVARHEVAAWPAGEPFALWPRMQTLTLEIVMRVVFGDRADDPRLDPLRRHLTELTGWLNKPRNLAALTLLGPEWVRHSHAYHQAMRPVEDEALAEVRRRRSEPTSARPDVVSMLIAARREDGSPLGEQELRDELVTLLSDGPTSTSLAWAFERLLRNPETLARARREIDEDLGDAYLDAVVKETLRLRPPVPVVVRTLREPMRLAGRDLPAGTIVAPCIHLLHRDPRHYPEPLRFRPERFLEKPAGTYTWIPFGGGVRRCIAAPYAELEMKRVLREVLAAVDLRPVDGRDERVRKAAISFSPGEKGLVMVG